MSAIVSIALCTYNGENFLEEQLRSIINQTYPDLEIIICDDCSEDKTRSILGEYELKYPFIKVYYNERNLGYVKNFEKAIKLCGGDYIALSDQDDIWDTNKIAILLKNIEDNILIYHDSVFINDKGEKLSNKAMSNLINMYQGRSCLPFILANCISGHSMLFKRELLKFLFPFDARFYHDWWIAYVAINIGTIKYLNEALVQYRQHQESITDPLRIKSEKRFERKKQRMPVDTNWLKKCSEYYFNKEKKLLTTFYELHKNIEENKKKWRSFVFIMKHYDCLFYINYPRKSYLSKLNRVRKIVF